LNIRSTPSGLTPKTQAQRGRDTAPATAGRPGGPAPGAAGPPVDRVELSPEARELSARANREPETGSLTPERLAVLAERMRSGYYDRPDTVERLLDRLASELTSQD
jgi:hypothetical protein